MNGTHYRLAVLLALSALALAACGGGSVESPMDPGLSGDAAVFSTLGNGNGAPEVPAGDGVCDGCDGTCDGTGPHGPGNGTGDVSA